MKIEGERYQES